jgi:hypothetical protein
MDLDGEPSDIDTEDEEEEEEEKQEEHKMREYQDRVAPVFRFKEWFAQAGTQRCLASVVRKLL